LAQTCAELHSWTKNKCEVDNVAIIDVILQMVWQPNLIQLL